MTLLSPDEAKERWPADHYPPDTLGGMRRDIIIQFWELAAEIAASVEGKAEREVVLDLLATAAGEIGERQAYLDGVQEQALRGVFKEMMGYELPQ